jgi:hypothetical protein
VCWDCMLHGSNYKTFWTRQTGDGRKMSGARGWGQVRDVWAEHRGILRAVEVLCDSVVDTCHWISAHTHRMHSSPHENCTGSVTCQRRSTVGRGLLFFKVFINI